MSADQGLGPLDACIEHMSIAAILVLRYGGLVRCIGDAYLLHESLLANKEEIVNEAAYRN